MWLRLGGKAVRPWAVGLTVVALAAATAAVVAISDRGAPPGPAVGPSVPAQPGADPTGSGEPVGSGTPSPGSPGSPAPGGPTPGPAQPGDAALAAPISVRYSFDAAARAIADTTGHQLLRVVGAAGGTVTFVRHGAGRAATFPARCTRAPTQCPRAVLESTRPDLFNPGTRSIRYGASVLMARTDTASGANVVQKGYSTTGGTQFKLQIDGKAGQPSCVLARAYTIYRLIAPVGVADGRWHAVSCLRAGAGLSITVDGKTFSRKVPANLSIVNSEPLRIGGKGVSPHNDQYAGQLDEVFITIY